MFCAGTQALQQINMEALKCLTMAPTLCGSQKKLTHIMCNVEDKAGQQPSLLDIWSHFIALLAEQM